MYIIQLPKLLHTKAHIVSLLTLQLWALFLVTDDNNK